MALYKGTTLIASGSNQTTNPTVYSILDYDNISSVFRAADLSGENSLTCLYVAPVDGMLLMSFRILGRVNAYINGQIVSHYHYMFDDLRNSSIQLSSKNLSSYSPDYADDIVNVIPISKGQCLTFKQSSSRPVLALESGSYVRMVPYKTHSINESEIISYTENFNDIGLYDDSVTQQEINKPISSLHCNLQQVILII